MGKKRKVSVISVSAGRRCSQDQASPETTTTIQQERRGSTAPLIHFSQVVQELQEEDLPYGFQPIVEKVPPPPPQQPDQEPEPKKDDLSVTSLPSRGAGRRWAYKNVFGVSISFLCIFSSFNSLQNLQSTINSSGGLGLASLSLLYAFFTLAGFISPSILKILGTKYSLLACFFCHLLYTLANYYPSWYTLIPVSVLLGAASALIWVAGSSHLVQIAVKVAPRLGVDKDHLISTYTGVFFAFFLMTQIPGNLASSLILFPYDGIANSTAALGNESDLFTSNSSMCVYAGTGDDFDRKLLYILVSVYVVFVIMGIIILATVVSNLGTEENFMTSKNKFQLFFKAPLVELCGVMRNYRMVLIIPISLFNGLEQSFAFGTFPQAFIAQCFGTYQVGFTLITLGLSSAFMSILYGKLAKYIPRLVIFLFGSALNSGLLVFLLVWTPVPSYVFIFLFAVLWGAGDGVWNTMTTSLIGILFPDSSGSAYSAQRIYFALGLTMGFVMAEFLTVEERVWFMLGAVLLALTAVFIVELSTQKFCLRCGIKGGFDSSDSRDTNDTADTEDIKDTGESKSNDAVAGGITSDMEKCQDRSPTEVKIEVVEATAL